MRNSKHKKLVVSSLVNPSSNLQVSEPTAPAPAQLCAGKGKTCVSDGDQHQALLPPAHLQCAVLTSQ